MALAATHAPLFFYAPPSKPSALYQNRFGSIETARKFAQGAGTALLAYSGAGDVAGSASSGGALAISDLTTPDGLLQAVLDGHMTGPAQLIAGALLFIAAGKCTARVVGLGAGLALVYLYSQGHTLQDGWQVAQDLAVRVSAAVSAFKSAGAAGATF